MLKWIPLLTVFLTASGIGSVPAFAQQQGASPAPPAATKPATDETTVPEAKPTAPADKPAEQKPGEQKTRRFFGKAKQTPPPPVVNPDTLKDAERKAYVIGPEDVLFIRVWDQGNLSGAVNVGPDGKISMQLIDEFQAAGFTPEQLKAEITKRLTKFIVNPEVNVQVIRVNSRKYIIQGEVNRPGIYSLTAPTTILEALVNGGGFRDFANTKKIYVLRGTQKLTFNYKEVSHGKRTEQNVLVENGDQIFVP